MRGKWVLGLGLWLCMCQLSLAQTCALVGTIADAQTRLPLAGAGVYVLQTQAGVYTDPEGHFYVQKLPCLDSATVRIFLVGYKPLEQKIGMPTKARLAFFLTQVAAEQREVEVVGQHSHPTATGQSAATLSEKDLDAVQGLPLAQQLAGIPGVSVLKTGPTVAKPIIHGLYGNRVLIMNNGLRQEGQQWGTDHAPELDPYGASQLQVLRGASALRYGSDAIGGVVLVEPGALPVQRGISGKAQLAGFSNGWGGAGSLLLEGGAGGRLHGLGWRVQSSARQSGFVRAPAYFLDNTSVKETNASASLGFTRARYSLSASVSQFQTKLGLFSGASVATVADVEAAIARGNPVYRPFFSFRLNRPYQYTQHRVAKLQGHYHFSDITSLEVVYGFQQNQRQEYDYVPLSGRTNPELDLTLSTQTITAEVHHHLRPGMIGTAGVQGIAQVNTWKGEFLIPNFASQAGGAFLTERFQIQSLTLEVGARVDSKTLVAYFRDAKTQQVFSQNRQFWKPSLSLGAEYLAGKVLLSGQLATAWRPPSANELYSNGVHQSAVSFEKGNAGLRSEQAYTASFTASYANGPLQAEATLYANRMQGYIYLRPDSAPIKTVRGAFPAFSYTQTNALLAGWDVQAKWSISPVWHVLHKSSWLRGQDLNAHAPLIFMPANRFEQGVRYQPKGLLARVSAYGQATVSTVLRQNRFPPGVDYALPPAAYTLVNLEAGITVPQKGGKGLTLVASVFNLFNSTYRDYLNRFRYFMPEAGRGFALRASFAF